MKKQPIRLYEADIVKIVQKVITEQQETNRIKIDGSIVKYLIGGTRWVDFDSQEPNWRYIDTAMQRQAGSGVNPNMLQNYAKPTVLNNPGAILKAITSQMIPYGDLVTILKNPQADVNATVKAMNETLRKYKPEVMKTWAAQNLGKTEDGNRPVQEFHQFVDSYYGG